MSMPSSPYSVTSVRKVDATACHCVKRRVLAGEFDAGEQPVAGGQLDVDAVVLPAPCAFAMAFVIRVAGLAEVDGRAGEGALCCRDDVAVGVAVLGIIL